MQKYDWKQFPRCPGASEGATEMHYFDDWAQHLRIVIENLFSAFDWHETALAAGQS